MDSSRSCLEFIVVTADWIIIEQESHFRFAKQKQILETFLILFRSWASSQTFQSNTDMNVGQQKHSRFLVVDYKADEISVVWRSVAFPGQFYSIALGIVGLES